MCRLHMSPISLKLCCIPGILKYLHPEICGYFIHSLEEDPSEGRQSLYLITKTWQVPQEARGGEGATGNRTHMDHCILCQLERQFLRVNQEEPGGLPRPAPTSCTENHALWDPDEGPLRFQAEAEATHVDSSSAELQGEWISETPVCPFQKHLIHSKVSFTLKAQSLNPGSKLENIAKCSHISPHLPPPTPNVYRKEGGLPSVKTSSFLFLLNADVLQSEWTWDEANLTAFLHQPSYPPVIVILLECRNKTAINRNILIFTSHLLISGTRRTDHHS